MVHTGLTGVECSRDYDFGQIENGNIWENPQCMVVWAGVSSGRECVIVCVRVCFELKTEIVLAEMT